VRNPVSMPGGKMSDSGALLVCRLELQEIREKIKPVPFQRT
jgi:hypothetical protein